MPPTQPRTLLLTLFGTSRLSDRYDGLFPVTNLFGSLAILGSFGESVRGYSEEARTRGFPSPSFGGFGFIVAPTNYSRKSAIFQLVNYLERVYDVWQADPSFQRTKQIGSEGPYMDSSSFCKQVV